MSFSDYLIQRMVQEDGTIGVGPTDITNVANLEVDSPIEDDAKDNDTLDVEQQILEVLFNLTSTKASIKNHCTLLLDDMEIGSVFFIGLNDATMVLMNGDVATEHAQGIKEHFIHKGKGRSSIKRTNDYTIIDIR